MNLEQAGLTEKFLNNFISEIKRITTSCRDKLLNSEINHSQALKSQLKWKKGKRNTLIKEMSTKKNQQVMMEQGAGLTRKSGTSFINNKNNKRIDAKRNGI